MLRHAAAVARPEPAQPALWSLRGRARRRGRCASRVGPGQRHRRRRLGRLRQRATCCAATTRWSRPRALQVARGAGGLVRRRRDHAPLLALDLARRAGSRCCSASVALAAALWRAAVRFGPLAAAPCQPRRSMAEQVRGTARFLRRHGARALHAAQRARAARRGRARSLPRHCAHRRRRARRAAIARPPAWRRGAAPRAAGPPRTHARPCWRADLELLETARRRLDARARAPTTFDLMNPRTSMHDMHRRTDPRRRAGCKRCAREIGKAVVGQTRSGRPDRWSRWSPAATC